jgi:hypothetical protein
MKGRGAISMSEHREAACRRYVLGTAPPDEAARLEREFLAEDAAYEELEAVEDELFHAYARGELHGTDRDAFERRFLVTPAGRDRAAAAGAFLAALDARRSALPARGPAPWLALAAALLAGLTGYAWVASRVPGARGTAESSPMPPTVPAAAPSVAPPAAPAGRTVLLALAAGLTRASAAPRRVALPADADLLRLDAALPPGAAVGPYDAILRDAEGEAVFTAGPLAAQGSTVVVEIPARALAEGDYELVLTGQVRGQRVEAADYAFGILRE